MFEPKHLTRAAVKHFFDDYLARLEVSQLEEHLRLLLLEHAPAGELEMDESRALVARVETERDRLMKLARKGK